MQNLMGYPVIDIGFLLVPRGIGTMIAMITVGRLSRRVDARYMILVGFVLTAISLWEMTHFSLDISRLGYRPHRHRPGLGHRL